MTRSLSSARALRTRLAPVAALVAASCVLAACGGGGDSKLSLNENGEISLNKRPSAGQNGHQGGSGAPAANQNTNSRPVAPAPGLTAGNTGSGTPGNPGATGNQGGAAGNTAVQVRPVNSIAAIKASRNAPHEGTSAEMWSSYWSNGAAVLNPVAPARTRALGAFGQIFAAEGNDTTLVNVQLRNMETYVRSEGKWRRVQYSNKMRAAFYSPGYENRSSFCPSDCVRPEPSGGVSIDLREKGTFVRFWPEVAFTESLIEPEKIEAVLTTVQARLVNFISSGTDYRQKARYLVNVGATWATRDWTKASTRDGSTGAFDGDIYTEIGNGKLTLMTNDWQSLNFTTATDTQIDELALADAGARAPIANSLDRDNALTRIMILGDDVVQGVGQSTGVAQDSFRRLLWNGLVVDSKNPRVDFVGTRRGPFSPGERLDVCEEKVNRTTTDYADKYFLPEFDTAHQGYGAHCAGQISGDLSGKFSPLALAFETPDVAIISVGTANLRADSSAEGVNKAMAGLKELIARLRADNDGMTILVAQIPPILTSAGTEDPNVAIYNARIAAEIPALSGTRSKIHVVDTHTGFTTGMLRNAYLPNDEGEAFLASKWLQALKKNNLVSN